MHNLAGAQRDRTHSEPSNLTCKCGDRDPRQICVRGCGPAARSMDQLWKIENAVRLRWCSSSQRPMHLAVFELLRVCKTDLILL